MQSKLLARNISQLTAVPWWPCAHKAISKTLPHAIFSCDLGKKSALAGPAASKTGFRVPPGQRQALVRSTRPL